MQLADETSRHTALIRLDVLRLAINTLHAEAGGLRNERYDRRAPSSPSAGNMFDNVAVCPNRPLPGLGHFTETGANDFEAKETKL